METAGPLKEEEMEGQLQCIALAKTLDRLKACVDGYSKKVCLSQEECAEVCVYIYWLTDQIAYAKAKDREAIMREESKENADI